MRLHTLFINIITSFLFCLTSCGSNVTDDATSPQISKELFIQDTINNKESKIHIDTIPVRSSKQIIGIWATTDKEILTVDISKDSIFYTEHFESHKYQIKGDSIYIDYLDFSYTGRPYIIKDTLIFSSIDGESKYIKIKK